MKTSRKSDPRCGLLSRILSWRFRSAAIFLVVFPTFFAASSCAAEVPGNEIVLIGGKWPYNPGSHEWPHGIELFEDMLVHSPQFDSNPDLKVAAYPHNWPTEEQLANAATIVLYFSGDKLNPLLDPQKRRMLSEQMEKGVGLVALHQAFTLPQDDTTVALKEWLGGARYGKANRTTRPAAISVNNSRHPVSMGIENFVLNDEFYPEIRFNEVGGQIDDDLVGGTADSLFKWEGRRRF